MRVASQSSLVFARVHHDAKLPDVRRLKTGRTGSSVATKNAGAMDPVATWRVRHELIKHPAELVLQPQERLPRR